MDALILAATHERALNASGVSVPQPLLDLDEEPMLTVLVKRLTKLEGLDGIHVVTNEAIRPELDAWAAGLPAAGPPVAVYGDGTHSPGDRLGAFGDVRFGIEAGGIAGDLLVVGGDNWMSAAFDLAAFVARSRGRSPAVALMPYREGWHPSRFGMARVDSSGRVVAFEEKPAEAALPLVSACVYYFAAADLPWLGRFAAEHDAPCSTGTFLQWLAGRTPVYGVEMLAGWYDVASHTALGPNALRVREVLRSTISPTQSTWAGAAARQLQWVNTHEDLLPALRDPDANRRIVAARFLGRLVPLLDEGQRAGVVRALLDSLRDGAQNDYEYGTWQSDEESAAFVSATAAESLVEFGYAADAEAVLARAAEAGYKVAERRNRP